MDEPKRRGRPPINGHDALGEHVQTRCSRAEKELWSSAARAKHCSLGEAMRAAMTGWAQDVLQLTDEQIAEALMDPERSHHVDAETDAVPDSG